MSNIIRQKILVGIETAKVNITSNKLVCLFLPEGEYHELALLFVAFLMKKKGLAVIYLGASIPMTDIDFIVQFKKPDYLYTHITTAGLNFNFDKFISNISKKFTDLEIIVSGKLTKNYLRKIPYNIKFKKSLSEVQEFVTAL